MNTPLQTLMQQEMTRKQFLLFAGVSLMGVAGLGPILKLIFGHHATAQPFSLPSQPPKSYGRSS